MQSRRRFAALAIAAIAGAGRATSIVVAQQASPAADEERKPVQFIARPEGGNDGDIFRSDLEAGQSIQLTMLVSNEGTIPFALDVFMSDVSSAPNGGLIMAPQGSERTAQTLWVDFTDQLVDLQPGEEKPVQFSIAVPEGTGPGQYINAIAVQTVDAYEIEGNTSFLQRVRKVLPVYVVVPGEMTASFTLGDPSVEFRTRGPVIVVPFTNTGNVRVAPGGTMTVFDPSGVELISTTVALGSVFPGNETTIEVRLAAPLPAGEYLVSLDLTDTYYEVSASLDQAALVMPEPPVKTDTTVTVTSATVTPNAEPIQFATISVALNNAGAAIASATATVVVNRDGSHVEDFVLASNLAIPEGDSTVEQRYIPITGFEPGTWTFSLTLDAVDASTGQATPLLTQENFATLEVT